MCLAQGHNAVTPVRLEPAAPRSQVNQNQILTHIMLDIFLYYIPINDPAFELSVFWPSDTESRINELRFSESNHYLLKRDLRRLPAFAATLRKVN